jgi:hypothetical protein
VHYTDIEKKAVAKCLRFATSNTVRKQFYHYLLINGYVERVRRGVYKATPKGEKLRNIKEFQVAGERNHTQTGVFKSHPRTTSIYLPNLIVI